MYNKRECFSQYILSYASVTGVTVCEFCLVKGWGVGGRFFLLKQIFYYKKLLLFKIKLLLFWRDRLCSKQYTRSFLQGYAFACQIAELFTVAESVEPNLRSSPCFDGERCLIGKTLRSGCHIEYRKLFDRLIFPRESTQNSGKIFHYDSLVGSHLLRSHWQVLFNWPKQLLTRLRIGASRSRDTFNFSFFNNPSSEQHSNLTICYPLSSLLWGEIISFPAFKPYPKG